jgi:hypothetical protein
MRKLANLKLIFKLRALLGILAFLLLCIPHPFYLLMGVGMLILLWMLDDLRTMSRKNIQSEASIDRPE